MSANFDGIIDKDLLNIIKEFIMKNNIKDDEIKITKEHLDEILVLATPYNSSGFINCVTLAIEYIFNALLALDPEKLRTKLNLENALHDKIETQDFLEKFYNLKMYSLFSSLDISGATLNIESRKKLNNIMENDLQSLTINDVKNEQDIEGDFTKFLTKYINNIILTSNIHNDKSINKFIMVKNIGNKISKMEIDPPSKSPESPENHRKKFKLNDQEPQL